MDGLGGATTVISILQTAWQVIEYIKAVRGAEDDRKNIVIELIRARALLFSLNDVAVDTKDDEWARALQGLNRPDGVLASFKALLEELMDKLGVQKRANGPQMRQSPQTSTSTSQPTKRRDHHRIPFLQRAFRSGHGRSSRPANGLAPGSEPKSSNVIQVLVGDMTWPFTQPEVLEYLKTLERIKTDLILALSSDNIRLSKLMHDRLQVVAGEVHTMTDDVMAVRQHLLGSGEWTEQQKLVLQSIASVDYSSNTSPGEMDKLKQGAIRLLYHKAFLGWLTSENGTTSLLLSGPPGIGKSSICKVVENYVQTTTPQSSIFVVAIYPTFARVKNLQTVLAYIVDRLLKTRPQVQIYYNQLMLTGEGELEISDCFRIIHRARQDFQEFYVLIDALDEFEDDSACQIVERLTQLRTPIKVFATSREFPHLLRIFKNIVRAQDIYNGGLRDIIVDELRRKVSNNDKVQLDLLQACSQEILERSNGLLLWVKLVLDQLPASTTPEDIKLILLNQPNSLEDMYSKIFNQMAAQSRKDAIARTKVFKQLCDSPGPRRADEVMDDIAKDVGWEKTDDPLLTRERIDFCIQACGNLVSYTHGGMFAFAHITVRHYIEKHGLRHDFRFEDRRHA